MTNRDVQRDFGRRVSELRKRKRLTQEQLAEAIGKSSETISNIERGTSAPRFKTAARIADALSVDLTDLFVAAPVSTDDALRRQAMDRLNEICRGQEAQFVMGLVDIAEKGVELKAPQVEGADQQVTES